MTCWLGLDGPFQARLVPVNRSRTVAVRIRAASRSPIRPARTSCAQAWMSAMQAVTSQAAGRSVRNEPSACPRSRLDLRLSHHGVADNPGDQASEPVPRRMSDHHLVFHVLGQLGQLLRELG